MNLLIVDDEYYYAEGIKCLLDWSHLGFNQVDCAYSMQQAQEVFQSKHIDLMISDIEMPKGSGLELLEWVNSKGYTTVTVFLTAYANFNYASSAIKLQSVDYLLKPIGKQELETCTLQAIKKIKQQQITASYNFTENPGNKINLSEQFWNSLCTQVIPEDIKQIQRALKQFCLPLTMNEETFYICLLRAFIKNENDRWEINLYEYAIKNVIAETLESSEALQVISRLNNDQYFLCLNALKIPDRTVFISHCNKIIKDLSMTLPGVFQLYAGQLTSLLHIGKSFQDLLRITRNNIYDQHQVIDYLMPSKAKTERKSNFMNDWADLLLQHKYKETYDQALLYLSELQLSRSADRSDLIKFKHNFIQIIYSILEKKGESAHRLFSDSTTEIIFEQSCDSIDTMKEWIARVIQIFDACLQLIHRSESSVEIIRRYIIEHIDEDLSRKKLATIVFLSPDYLSHMFREQTGESLSGFILAERIRKSKELLLTTTLNIRDIALQSGFPSISYFSRQFKSATGNTPQEFRKIQNS